MHVKRLHILSSRTLSATQQHGLEARLDNYNCRVDAPVTWFYSITLLTEAKCFQRFNMDRVNVDSLCTNVRCRILYPLTGMDVDCTNVSQSQVIRLPGRK
jgi:hypothetical protein